MLQILSVALVIGSAVSLHRFRSKSNLWDLFTSFFSSNNQHLFFAKSHLTSSLTYWKYKVRVVTLILFYIHLYSP